MFLINFFNLSSFNTNNVTNMNSMFYNCSSLTFLDLSNVSLNNYINIQNMFFEVNKDCKCIFKDKKLKQIKDGCFIF